MLTVTLLYAGLLGLLMAVLSVRIPLRRVQQSIAWGHGDDAVLSTRIRIFGNFTEYVPMLLLLMGYLELSGAAKIFLHIIGTALVLVRLLHVFSLKKINATQWQKTGRFISTCLTLTLLVTLSSYAIFLSVST
jgi:uncharacterized membrane protein YecN with MAPEG domain